MPTRIETIKKNMLWLANSGMSTFDFKNFYIHKRDLTYSSKNAEASLEKQDSEIKKLEKFVTVIDELIASGIPVSIAERKTEIVMEPFASAMPDTAMLTLTRENILIWVPTMKQTETFHEELKRSGSIPKALNALLANLFSIYMANNETKKWFNTPIDEAKG